MKKKRKNDTRNLKKIKFPFGSEHGRAKLNPNGDRVEDENTH